MGLYDGWAMLRLRYQVERPHLGLQGHAASERRAFYMGQRQKAVQQLAALEAEMETMASETEVNLLPSLALPQLCHSRLDKGLS